MQLQFDATQYNPQQGPSALPVSDSQGWPVRIVASEAKPTKDGKGGYLELTLEIIDGQFKGTRGADRLNIWNQFQEAVDIAFRRLSAYCHVIGKYRIGQSEELHNQPFRVVVRQQKNNPEYTEIYTILDINGNPPGKAGALAAAPQPAAWQAAPAQETPAAWQAPQGAAPVTAPQPDNPVSSGPWQAGGEKPPATAPWNK